MTIYGEGSMQILQWQEMSQESEVIYSQCKRELVPKPENQNTGIPGRYLQAQTTRPFMFPLYRRGISILRSSKCNVP